MGSVPIFAISVPICKTKKNPDPVAIGIVQLITRVNGPLHVTCNSLQKSFHVVLVTN